MMGQKADPTYPAWCGNPSAGNVTWRLSSMLWNPGGRRHRSCLVTKDSEMVTQLEFPITDEVPTLHKVQCGYDYVWINVFIYK